MHHTCVSRGIRVEVMEYVLENVRVVRGGLWSYVEVDLDLEIESPFLLTLPHFRFLLWYFEISLSF